MVARVDYFDYTSLAGLRRTTVTLCDVTIYQCEMCGPTSAFVEICRIADLTRELAAAKAIHVKELWCSFRDNEWTIALTPQEPMPQRRGKKSS